MLSTFRQIVHLTSIRNTDNLITLGITSAENKGLEYTIAYNNIDNNIESRFPNQVFYMNFDELSTLYCYQKQKKIFHNTPTNHPFPSNNRKLTNLHIYL